jgi:hypothetical protein
MSIVEDVGLKHPQGASMPMGAVPKAATSAYKEPRTSSDDVKFA